MTQSSFENGPQVLENNVRQRVIDQFLRDTAWADWTRHPLAGDASARRYQRLGTRDQSVILMDDPVNMGGATERFAKVAWMLTSQGLCAPEILAHAPQDGLMIIGDLGSTDFAEWLRHHPQDQSTLYHAATDALIQLHHGTCDLKLAHLTPAVGGEMIGVLDPYYTQTPLADLTEQLILALEEYAPTAKTVALRDFHAENLIWRPNEVGNQRVGLLDFQDALYAPAGYDLASLLRDARRDISNDLAEELISYFIANLGLGQDFRAQLAVLGVQRNLRILGIFTRLAKRDGKPRYLGLLPRVWSHIQEDLKHPALRTLQECVNDTLQPPTKPVSA
ncbi:aminoglycoside phosphotransferase family protein [Yoonia sediminilitoris]|uniref:Aminoglycoside phosphotransferase domain-containing protein n=1 Tax=Yoonia sediminilitoris TaxID=1286148 RepID=A0A2T6KLU6_9RHOB|nr:phosphotransferase [Yoonia sediminilitoris]PUB17198.1 hypothetical protein C8N45_102208 [Yoonia sediminilitoris]RCW97493.1 hypothetical protein DFP92_102208 [Yoonia sediminilitoris]